MNELSADSVLNRLQTVFDVRSDSALARTLDLNRATLGNWRKRDSIPYSICVQVALDHGLSLNWLLAGQGSPREILSSQDIHIVNEQVDVASISELFDSLDVGQQQLILETMRTAKRLTTLERTVEQLRHQLIRK